jgi:hypothetical protein
MCLSIPRDSGAPNIEVIHQYRDEGWFLALVEAAQHQSLVVEKVSIYISRQSVWLLGNPNTTQHMVCYSQTSNNAVWNGSRKYELSKKYMGLLEVLSVGSDVRRLCCRAALSQIVPVMYCDCVQFHCENSVNYVYGSFHGGPAENVIVFRSALPPASLSSR